MTQIISYNSWGDLKLIYSNQNMEFINISPYQKSKLEKFIKNKQTNAIDKFISYLLREKRYNVKNQQTVC